MKQSLLKAFLTVCILSMQFAVAAPKNQPAPKTTPVVQPAVSPDSYSSKSELSGFSVSGPLSLLDGELYWGANVGYLMDLNSDLKVGGETGFYIYPGTVTGWVIPIVGAVIYDLKMDTGSITPFVGASLGLCIASVSAGGFSSTSAKFAGYAHLGAYFGSDQRLFADIRLGTMAETFLLAPTIGYRF